MKLGYFKLLVPVLLAIALMALGVAPGDIEQTSSSGQSLTYHSSVIVHKNNEFLSDTENIITDNGTYMILSSLFFAKNFSEVRYIAIGGNRSVLVSTNTSLANENSGNGLDRAAATSVAWAGGNPSYNVSLTKQFTATAATRVNITGLFNASSGDSMFAQAGFSDTTLQSDDTLNVTWYIWVS